MMKKFGHVDLSPNLFWKHSYDIISGGPEACNKMVADIVERDRVYRAQRGHDALQVKVKLKKISANVTDHLEEGNFIDIQSGVGSEDRFSQVERSRKLDQHGIRQSPEGQCNFYWIGTTRLAIGTSHYAQVAYESDQVDSLINCDTTGFLPCIGGGGYIHLPILGSNFDRCALQTGLPSAVAFVRKYTYTQSGLHSADKHPGKVQKPTMTVATAKYLVFALNGQRTEVDPSQIDPATTLLSYLRYHTQYRGAKLGCGEGGCGACVVLLSKYNTTTEETEEFSISSCLTLLGSIDGCSVTTSEGLGNCRDGYHAIHRRIAGFHASQCGFCTPGWCMSLYGALRQAEAKGTNDVRNGFSNLSVLEAEKAIAGNLCRCTGYRPMADVCKSFARDVDLEDLGLNSFWKKNELADPNQLPKYNPTAVYTNTKFCSQNCEESRTPILNFAYKDKFDGEEHVWVRPSNLEEILETLAKSVKENIEPKLVVGNTSTGIYKDIKPKVIVDIGNIPELHIIKRHDFGIEVGAAVTITKLIKVLEDTSALADNVLDPGKVIYTGNCVFQGIASHLKKVASGFIRNTASVGGNLIMAQKLSFDSDVATILLGANALVKIISAERIESVLTMEEFLDKPCLDSGVLLLSIYIPHWTEVSNPVEDGDINGSIGCYEKLLFKTYRAAPRPLGNAVSYVNAAFLAQISPSVTQGYQVAKSLRLAFGAFGVRHAIRATSVEEFLVDKVISPAILLEAIEMVKVYVIPREGTRKSAYRKSVAVGFLFDFLCPFVKDMVPPCITDSLELGNSQSGSIPNIGKGTCKPKSLTDGKQKMKFHLDYHPVGQPSSKVASELQASGEAVYVDDIPSPENCLYGAYVYSKKALALIKKVDVKHALESPSVVSYISSTDIPKQGKNVGAEALFGGEILLAEDTVECFGQPIGLMVAKTWHDAKRAADRVRVDYDCETLGPPILSVEDAGEKKSFFQVPEWYAPKPVGDFSKGMSEADHEIESAEVRIGSQYYFYLETQTALAIPDEDECMVVYSSCQNPCIAQKSIAKCLGIPIHNVRVITRRVGGGFGGKAFRSVPMSLAVVKEGDGFVEEEDSVVKRYKAMVLTPIVVMEIKHYEVINDPCLVKIAVVLARDEFKVERMHNEEEGKEKGMAGTPCPNRHDENKLVGLFRITVTKEQIDGAINKKQSQFCHHPKKDLQRTNEDDIMED
ncbi:hypothetical protein KI387_018415 [Taxus chinensis]|uniref:Aldehyde oxidase n=1 Tax=Taxus chinensis TaxID=29808 RepID=A0AA38GIQ9_TAXCH|nr:hypothetical protein KI387_018415 [Taxus chinensis]